MGQPTVVSPEQSAVQGPWLDRLKGLFTDLEGWAKQLGWSSKLVTKPMSDSQAGSYTAPALVVQCDTTRIMVEPVSRRAPGADGVVDLYLMPAYDDIASLYYYKNTWHIHHQPRRTAEAVAAPLTIDAFKQAVEAMAAHGG